MACRALPIILPQPNCLVPAKAYFCPPHFRFIWFVLSLLFRSPWLNLKPNAFKQSTLQICGTHCKIYWRKVWKLPIFPRRWRDGKYHKFILQLHKLFPERVQIYCPQKFSFLSNFHFILKSNNWVHSKEFIISKDLYLWIIGLSENLHIAFLLYEQAKFGQPHKYLNVMSCHFAISQPTLDLFAPDPFKIMLSKGVSLWKLWNCGY